MSKELGIVWARFWNRRTTFLLDLGLWRQGSGPGCQISKPETNLGKKISGADQKIGSLDNGIGVIKKNENEVKMNFERPWKKCLTLETSDHPVPPKTNI